MEHINFFAMYIVCTIVWVAEKIREALLWPFAELAGALVMRGLRKWAKGYRADDIKMVRSLGPPLTPRLPQEGKNDE